MSDETHVLALLKKKNYKVHICVGIMSNMPIPTVGIFGTGAGPNLFHTYFLPIKWSDRILPIHSMSLKSASNNLVNSMGKITLFVRLGDLQIPIHFGVIDNMALPILIGTPLLDRYVKVIFPMK